MSAVMTVLHPIRGFRLVMLVGISVLIMLVFPAFTTAQDPVSRGDLRFADQRTTCLFMEINIPDYDCGSAAAEDVVAEHQPVNDYQFIEENVLLPGTELRVTGPGESLNGYRFIEVKIFGVASSVDQSSATTREAIEFEEMNNFGSTTRNLPLPGEHEPLSPNY